MFLLQLSTKRRVTLQEFRGKTLVSIREYYMKDGKELPSSKGIHLFQSYKLFLCVCRNFLDELRFVSSFLISFLF